MISKFIFKGKSWSKRNWYDMGID